MLAIAGLSFRAGHYLITENIFKTLISRQCHSQDDHICSGLLHMRSASSRKGVRGNRSAPHRLAASPVTPNLRQYSSGGSLRRTSPEARQARPVCSGRGRQCAVFRFFRLDDRIPQSLLLALACSVFDNRHTQVAIANGPLFVPALRALRGSMGFSVGFYHVTFEIPAPYQLCPSQGDSEELF